MITIHQSALIKDATTRKFKTAFHFITTQTNLLQPTQAKMPGLLGGLGGAQRNNKKRNGKNQHGGQDPVGGLLGGVSNAVGGVTDAVGNVVGGTTRGLGRTVNNATGTDLGDTVSGVGSAAEGTTKGVGNTARGIGK